MQFAGSRTSPWDLHNKCKFWIMKHSYHWNKQNSVLYIDNHDLHIAAMCVSWNDILANFQMVSYNVPLWYCSNLSLFFRKYHNIREHHSIKKIIIYVSGRIPGLKKKYIYSDHLFLLDSFSNYYHRKVWEEY